MSLSEGVVYLALFLLGLAAIYFLRSAKGAARAEGKNPLKLRALYLIEEMQPTKSALIFTQNDQFILIADTLKLWHRKGKSITEVIDEGFDKEALIDDLYNLVERAKSELKDELLSEPENRSRDFEIRREDFLQHAQNQITYLRAWKPVPVQAHTVKFTYFKAEMTCYGSGDGHRKVTARGALRIEEEGEYLITQMMEESGENVYLMQCKITPQNRGQEIRLVFDTSGPSKVFLYKQETEQKDSVRI